MPFCLMPDKINAFKQALKTKKINIAEMLNLTTEQRVAMLREYAGENAVDVNRLFEQKLVLKNRMIGLKNWASKIGEVGRYDPNKKIEIDAKLAEFQAKQQERIFNPKENETFLSSLAEKEIGSEISREEARNVFGLVKMADALKKNFNQESGWTDQQSELSYGAAQVALENYTDALKLNQMTVKQLWKQWYEGVGENWSENKPRAVANVLLDTIKMISDNSIAFVASVDNSFLGRQGLKTLFTHPSAWYPAAKQSFVDIYRTIGGQKTKDAMLAKLYSQPNFMNGLYHEAGILTKSEEQYPDNLPGRIPGLGRIFQASELAFAGSAMRMRTAMFDMLYNQAKMKGEVMDKKQVKSIGTIVNSLTARGKWGKYGESAIVKLLLWSPRMLKANFDVLTAHTGQDISPFARREAQKNLLKIVAITALIMAMFRAKDPESVELDPRSADFGKIKVGNTRFDITGGAGALIVLAARLVSGASKSTTTGTLNTYGSGFGQTSRMDVLFDFFANKVTPPVRVILDVLRGSRFDGTNPTPANEIASATVPISVQNFYGLKDDSSLGAVMGAVLDLIGLSGNTYNTKTDWSVKPGVELQQFKTKVGDQKFKEANEKYNQQYAEWFDKVQTDPRYQALSDEDKKKAISSKKDKIKNAVFLSYGFKYHQVKTKKLPAF